MENADYKAIIEELLPHAEKELSVAGEFMPFAGIMSADGDIEMFLVGTPIPEKDEEVMDSLVRDLQKKVEKGHISATCIFADARVDKHGDGGAIKAVLADFEDQAGTAMRVFIPYSISGDNAVVFETTFGNDATPKIFKTK
ncbi:MAG: hypothetical protein HKM93_19095 [Desulfobacteraceae bacterium]|nr:hypothetical protein [Desulfobacteraceae bacterium]